jgi:hypothetical protein
VANNLHISYDLINPGQNYAKLIEKIKTLGSWARVHASFWYVNSSLTASQAVDALKPVLDSNDKVYIVDASNNNSAWKTLPSDVSELIKREWNR